MRIYPSDYKKNLRAWKIQGKISIGTQGNSSEGNVNTNQDSYIWGIARVLHHEDLHLSLVQGALTIIARVDVDEMEPATLQTRLLTQPQIARIVTEQNLVTSTICMALIDSTIPRLRKLPREITDENIWDIKNTLSQLRNEGVEVAWLERSLELFKQKRE
ncbi:unnamed protein product [Arabis nemorensis]|uniref:Uncharacterized protein n=1 Tax=Arabis nemorensis TaxID=586526 RepID=A0A565BQP6_9BRAS|nr:unnamed protein product [Arabis nemorensis]